MKHYLDPQTQRCGGCGKDATELLFSGESTCQLTPRRHYILQSPSGAVEVFEPR